MIIAIKILIRIIASILAVPMWWINIIIVLILCDTKFMVTDDLFDKIWDKQINIK